MVSRRHFISSSLLLASSPAILPQIQASGQKFLIGACDWSLGFGSDIRAFEVAKKIGVDGLMVDVGSPSNNLHLRERSVQEQYLTEAKRTNIKISSLALGALNNFPYKSDPQTEQWVWDSIDVAKNFDVTVILLAFFHNNDLRNDEQGIRETISRLKKVAPKAEKANVILGVESYLNGADHLRILEAVGSPNVKVYLDFRNTADAGLDVLKEVKQIGAANICELHMKENGHLLGKGSLPWNDIRDLMKEISYTGDRWMQIEGSNPPGADVVTSYRHNLKFLQKLFNSRSV
jgi:L-ribulose-5-phosphate 3-epimerase